MNLCNNAYKKTKCRDRAILLLLLTYGFRSGEVRNLKLSDIDWDGSTIKITRFKNYTQSRYPLDAEVGNAIIHYLMTERPKVKSDFIFLISLAPYSQLSVYAMNKIVYKRLCLIGYQGKTKKGPHSIRHAVAKRLLEHNFTYKVIGDQLGHKSMQSTAVYAKIDFTVLQRVAMPQISEFLHSKDTSGPIIAPELTKIMFQHLGDVL